MEKINEDISMEEAIDRVLKTCPYAAHSEMLMAAQLYQINTNLAAEFWEEYKKSQRELAEAAAEMVTDAEVEAMITKAQAQKIYDNFAKEMEKEEGEVE